MSCVFACVWNVQRVNLRPHDYYLSWIKVLLSQCQETGWRYIAMKWNKSSYISFCWGIEKNYCYKYCTFSADFSERLAGDRCFNLTNGSDQQQCLPDLGPIWSSANISVYEACRLVMYVFVNSDNTSQVMAFHSAKYASPTSEDITHHIIMAFHEAKPHLGTTTNGHH